MDVLPMGMQLMATGMVVVFSGLTILFLLMTLFQRIERARAQEPARAAPTPTPAPAPAPDTIPPEIVAAVSAAAALAIDKKVRITRIQYRGPSESTWSRQGRVTIMASHAIRR
jgi:Na+-transporting methylmalonyl-CoA/oxaloacetate decarboxylase gamma subunit